MPVRPPRIPFYTLGLSALALIMAAMPLSAVAGSYERTTTGIVVRPDHGTAREVRLEVIGGDIIHVLALDDPSRPQIEELVAVARPSGAFTVTADKAVVTLKAAKASATVSLTTGLVTFANAAGQPVLREDAAALTPVTIEGKSYLATQARFNSGTTEALYGLGQHQNAQMNLNGEDVVLNQHNMDVGVPFIVSDRNYGLLWDNYSITRFGDPRPYNLFGHDLRLRSEDGKAGLTARYYVDGRLVLTRIEHDIHYQYQKDVDENFPAELADAVKAHKAIRVTWDGTLASDIAGVHKLQLYASDYATLTIGGKPVLDVWRQNWNPWYHNFTVTFARGKPVNFHLDWKPSGGMVAITHADPLPAPERHAVAFASEAGTGMNYYFIASDSMDGVIGGYRRLTGQAPLMPKWAYGYWQSRQRYTTQAELLDVVDQYRNRGWPLDNIVQDWSYWPKDAWGSHDFDPARFPDPRGMVDAVHARHAHIMISIWGKFYPTTDNYKELDAKGYMFEQNVKNGTKDFIGFENSHYSPYNQDARDIYYRQLKDKLVGLGFDAWWMDNTEPDVNSNERPDDFAMLITPTQMGPGAIVHNAYALETTRAIAEGLAKDQPDTRQFILTRSGFAGIQRNSAAVWSGDLVARWNNLYDQVAAGVNFSMSGIPNWTSDIGGYAQEARYRGTPKPQDLREWRELNLRWFQFGALSPLFRSHGEEIRREIYEISPDNSDMRDSMVWYDRLRYRLMPYIYATASDTWFASGTIMRGLVMDFPGDAAVKDIKDEYLFGHALLVAPVSEYQARSRQVYLPAGAAWYDFYGGEKLAGGQSHTVAAPVTQIPLFVRAGSIVPTGPVTQYVDEDPTAPLTLNVYTGGDGTFSLYEDDGVSLGYQKGAFSRIPLSYDDKTGTLTIGARAGSYPGMVDKRTFRVRFLTPGIATASGFDDFDSEVAYSGGSIRVRRPTAGGPAH